MILCLTFLIIIVAGILVYKLNKLDMLVVQCHREVIGKIFKIVEDIKDVRGEIHTINKLVRFLTQKKLIDVYKIINKAIDVLSIVLLFSKTKKKKLNFKSFMSAKFVKYAYSIYKTITA